MSTTNVEPIFIIAGNFSQYAYFNKCLEEKMYSEGVAYNPTQINYISDVVYLESDNDFFLNNHEAIIMLLEEGGLEKFAELIVRECSSLAYDGPGGILEHFGFKE